MKVINSTKKVKHTRARLLPTIPQDIDGMKLKITTLTVPPTPALQTQFTSDKKNIALWSNPYSPTLQCPSYQDAKALQCYLHPNCRCQPAESTANCLCTDSNVTANFYELSYRLPIRRPWITFMESGGGSRNVSVTAVVPNFSTAEFLLTIHEQFDATIKEVTDSVCKVQDADVMGCYQCDQGAVAQITCQSEDETVATIDCGDFTFSIPCNPQGVVSPLRFNLQHAQVHLTCSCSCGATKTHFELTGVLFWTRTFYGIAEKLLAGESNVYNEVKLPDLSHISSVLVAWYKFSIALVCILIIAVATGYLFLWSCGTRSITFCFRLFARGLYCILATFLRAAFSALRSRTTRARRHGQKEL